MASFVYPLGQVAVQNGVIDMADALRARLVTSAYTPAVTDEFAAIITGGYVLATSADLTGVTVARVAAGATYSEDGAAMDAVDVSFATVTGTPAWLVISTDTGSSATDRLIVALQISSPPTVAAADIVAVLNAAGIMGPVLA